MSRPGDLKSSTSLMCSARSTLVISARSFRQRTSLASPLKLACDAYDDTVGPPVTEPYPSYPSDPADQLRRRVAIKLDGGDVRGALRIAVNDSSLAFLSKPSVVQCMKRLHPPRSPTSPANIETTDYQNDVVTLVDSRCMRVSSTCHLVFSAAVSCGYGRIEFATASGSHRSIRVRSWFSTPIKPFHAGPRSPQERDSVRFCPISLRRETTCTSKKKEGSFRPEM